MSATADKARYFLERSVPELKELERKQILSPAEITAVSSKRSDFEHKINARGCTPTDFSAYATFEINLDTLRRKRVKRLGVKSTTHNGQTRVFFVFDRGLRKFPGDIGLWTQAIDYAVQQRANKKATRMFTDALRLNPTHADLWIMAARNAVERNGSMVEARGYAQRGLRFCKRETKMWTEYFKLEMLHSVVQGDSPPKKKKGDEISAEDILPNGEAEDGVDQDMIKKLESIPATSAAVPNAIFDAAMKQFNDDLDLAKQFFDITFEFDAIAAYQDVMEHIYNHMKTIDQKSWQTRACGVAKDMFGLTPDMLEFGPVLRSALAEIQKALEGTERPSEAKPNPFWTWCDGFLEGLWRKCDHDQPYKVVLESVLSKLDSQSSW